MYDLHIDVVEDRSLLSTSHYNSLAFDTDNLRCWDSARIVLLLESKEILAGRWKSLPERDVDYDEEWMEAELDWHNHIYTLLTRDLMATRSKVEEGTLGKLQRWGG